MIYISISAQAIELIGTTKNLFAGAEKINSVSRKIINKDSNLSAVLTEALNTAYPNRITQKEAKLVISDEELLIKRLTGDAGLGKVTPDSVIEKAKKILPQDIINYENFYKEIPGTSIVLYAAMPFTKIRNFSDVLSAAGLKLAFLSSVSFSLYALLKPILNKESRLIYANLDNNPEFIILDSEGPVEVITRKPAVKNIADDIKEVIKKLKTDNSFQISDVIIAGEKSLEINTAELSEDLSLPVRKISAVLENIFQSQKINLDTGGVPTLYFDKVIGLLNLSKMTEVPNFALDIKNILLKPAAVSAGEFKSVKTDDETGTISPVVKMEVEEESKDPVNMISETNYQLGSTSKNRSLLIIIFISIALILFGGFLLIGKSTNLAFPSFARPTLTPTSTPVPTLTPTPTIDPALKKSDIKLQIQNGTEKTGFAKETSDFLKESGYKNITTGNADKSDYATTVIKIKESKKQYLPLIINDLKDKFETSQVESLSDDSASDIVIILGQK